MPDVPTTIPLDQIDLSQLSVPAEAGIPLENLDLNQLATEQEYLEKLTPAQLADKEARAMRAGAPVHDLQKFEDASIKRRKEGTWFFEDKRTPEEKASEGEAPKYGWDAVKAEDASGGALGAALASPGLTVMRVGQNLFAGTFSFLNEVGKMVTRNEVMATRSASPAERAENPNKVPVTTFEIPASDQPGANMTAAAKANLVSSANLLREGVTRVANKFFRNENDDEAYREQHRASVAFHAAEQDAAEGKSILPDGSQDRKTDSQAVDAVRQFPLLDPSMLIPFGTAAKGVEKAEALAAGTLAERIPAGLAARGLAKTADITAKALRISEKVVDTNPLARGLIAAGLTEAAGGDNSQAVIAGLLSANVKSLGLAKRTAGAAAGAFENTSGKLLGRIPPGPIGRFAASAYRSLSPEARVFAMGQVYNTPFLLGAESEEEFKDMLAAGVVIHSAVSATKGVRNGLSVGSNYFAEGDRAPEIRMNVKDLGIDPQLDTAHRDQMAKLDNSSSNFVQSVRDFMKKTGGEAYVLPVDAFNSYVDGLVGQQLVDRTGSPYVFTKENAELTKQQQGVTLRMPGEDGQIRNVALTPVLETRPGLSVGHEAGHLLEHALSPEELDHIYRRTHEYYGPEELSTYFRRHEQMIDPSVDVSKLPQTWDDLSADQQRHTLSEIFAEHASAALNGLPIGKFGFETGAKRYAHEVYGMLGRGLEKIGAKRPELSPAITDPKKQVHTGLGIEPSMRLSSLIEAVIAAKDADGLLAKADPKVEPAKPASAPVGSKAETAPVGSSDVSTQGPVSTNIETPRQNEITNIRPVEQKPVAPGFKKGDPVGDLKDGEGVLVGEDAKVVKPNADGTYDVEFIDPDTGARQIGTVPASMLESKVTPGVPVPPQNLFPPHPVTPDSPVGASPQPAALPAPKAVENTTRPQTEATPNVRTTPEKQQALAGPADPAVVAQNLALLKASDAKPRHARGAVETDYYSAKSPVAAPDQMVREAQRRAADAAETAGEPNPLRTRYQKIFVPYKVRENKNGSTTVFGMSLDKVAQNLDLLRGWLRLNPEAARTVDTSYLNGREIATDLQAYLSNQANGYAGDGRKLTRPADAREITPENPDFVPQTIAPAKAQVLNLLMGMEQPQTETPGQAFARRFAEANGITVPEVAGVSDTNTLRAALRGHGFDPRILNAVVENLRVDRFTTPLKPRPELDFPAGDTGFQRAGFMPSTEKPVVVGKVEEDGLVKSVSGRGPGVQHGSHNLKAHGPNEFSWRFRPDLETLYWWDRPANEAQRESVKAHLEKKGFQVSREESIDDVQHVSDPDEREKAQRKYGQAHAAYMPDTSSTRRARGNDETREIVKNYIRDSRISNEPHEKYATIDEPRMKRIADWFDSAKHEPGNPVVAKAYDALSKETLAQYRAMVDAGISIEPFTGKGEPYASSGDMMRDVRENKHLYFLRTDTAFGDGQAAGDNPLLKPSGVTINGTPLLMNDLFRAVHDYFGHTADGFEFGPRGEYNAFLAHSRMFSDEAVPALAAETLAQNAWVNFGSQMRRSDGSLPKTGDSDFVPQRDRRFAEQKTTVVPADVIRDATSFMPKAPEFKLGKSKSEYGDEYRPVLVGKEEVGRIEQDYANGGFRALTSARDDLGTAPTAKEALKFFTEDSIKAKPAEPTPEPKQEKSAPAPTGWILPDGKYEGQTDRTGVYQNVGDWHSNHLEQNSAGYAERFGLNYSVKDGDLRRTALNKGFVRLRYDGATGRMGVEANAKFFKGRTRDKIGDILESNIAKIDRLDINLFDDSGNVVDVKNHPQLFRLSGLEKSIALEETLKSRATREVFMPSVNGVRSIEAEKLSEKLRNPRAANKFWLGTDGHLYPVSDHDRGAAKLLGEKLANHDYDWDDIAGMPEETWPSSQLANLGWKRVTGHLQSGIHIDNSLGSGPPLTVTQKKGLKNLADFGISTFVDGPQYRTIELYKGITPPDPSFMPKTLKPEEALGEFKEDTLASALKRPGWAILTATQERLGKADDPRNIAANIALEDHLKERGLPYQKVAGSYLGEDQGANFLVTGLSERSALALGKKFKQESVLSNRGYLYQDGSIAPLKHKNTVIGEEAKKQSGYSILPDGTAFSAGIDWDTRIQPDPRETPAYRKIAQHLTEAERENMRSDAATEIVRLFEELPHDEEFETAVRLGHVKKGWYERAAKTLREIFGEDTDAFVGLLAATSPRQTVIENLKMSLRVWKKWNEAGRPIEVDTLKEMFAKDVEMKSRLPNTVRALTGKDIAGSEIVESKKLNPGTALSGFKVESFRRNLLGDLQHSTNDAWMAQFAEIQQKIFGTKTGYLAFTAKVRRIATKMDLEAAHVQETIWCFFKTLVEGTTVDRPAAEVLANLTERDILTTPEFHEQLISDPEIKTLLAELGITDDRVAGLADNEIAGKRANASDLPLSSTALPAEKDHSRVLKRLAARAQRIKDRELAGAPTEETAGDTPFMPRNLSDTAPLPEPKVAPTPPPEKEEKKAPKKKKKIRILRGADGSPDSAEVDDGVSKKTIKFHRNAKGGITEVELLD